MLKDFGYSGIYKDERMSVDVILRVPTDYNLAADTLVFGVMINPKPKTADALNPDDFRFYVKDEDYRLYNTRYADELSLEPITDEFEGEFPNALKGFILTQFKHEFLYQDIRVLVYYKPYNRFEAISFEH